MSNETLFYYLNATVPANRSILVQTDHWRYSPERLKSEVKVWLTDPDRDSGEWFYGTPEELLERIRTKCFVPLQQAA
jgi:hypothetical protein